MKKVSITIFIILFGLFLVSCNNEKENNGQNEIINEKAPVGYVNVLDFGANGNDGADDFDAFVEASLTGKSIYVPAGTYYVSGTIKLMNQDLRGDGMFQTKIYSIDPSPTAVVIQPGRSSTVQNMTIGFRQNLLTGNENEGERVGILTGHIYSLQRGASVRNVRIENVGTGIYSGYVDETTSFSVTYDTLEIYDFTYRGIDFRSAVRTGNVFNNIYIMSKHEVDSLFALEGEESETIINQLNLEHTKVKNTAMILDGVRAFKISTLHIEGVSLILEGGSFIRINNSAGSIDALSVYYVPIDYHNTNLFKLENNQYNINHPFKPASLGYLHIGVLHLKGLNDPHAPIHGARANGLLNETTTGFNLFYRELSAKNDYLVTIDHYAFFTFKQDAIVYEAFPSDPNNKIIFTKKGNIKTYGKSSERPTTRLVPYYSFYYDTTLNKMLMWDGNDWKITN